MNNSVTRLFQDIPGVFFLMLMLHFGQIVFIPLFFGLFLAIVLYPVCKYLESKHCSRGVSIASALLLAILFFSFLLWLLVFQLQAFLHDIPEMRGKIASLSAQVQHWIETTLSISIAQQRTFIANTAAGLEQTVVKYLQTGIGEMVNILFMTFIVPVFATLFLFNRETFVHFLQLAFRNTTLNVREIIKETIYTYLGFLKGMIKVYLIVGVLNSIGLLALGIEHAILFGMVTALMTIIPYIGIVISAAVPISVAWISTGTIWLPLAVVAVFSFIQYLEAYIIFPRIVGSQINVSSWSALIAALIGGIVWGVAGMVLFIPFVGVLKILSDNIEEWSALNVLLSSKPASERKVATSHKRRLVIKNVE